MPRTITCTGEILRVAPDASFIRSGSEEPAKPKNQTAKASSASPTETSITWSSTPPRWVEVRSARIERSQVARRRLSSRRPVRRPWSAVEDAQALADDRHPDRQPEQDQQVRAGRRARGVRDPRGEVDQPERDADPHHDGADGHQQHEHQGGRRPRRAEHRVLHVPGFRCDNRRCVPRVRTAARPRRARRLRVDERLARRRDPARRLRGHRLARRSAGGRRAGDRSGDVRRRRSARRSAACASGSASRAPRSGCRRSSSLDDDRAGRRGLGAWVGRAGRRGRRRRAVAAVRERVLVAPRRPAGAGRGAADGAARRAGARRWTSASASASCGGASRTRSATGRRRSRGCCGSSGSWRSRRRGGELARLAFAAGYADQAHLTRECRRSPAGRRRSSWPRARRRRASASRPSTC